MLVTSRAIASDAPYGSAPLLVIASGEQTVPHRPWVRPEDLACFGLSKDRLCPASVLPRNMPRRGYRRRLGWAACIVCPEGTRLLPQAYLATVRRLASP